MGSFRKFFEMQNVKYDFSSLQINVPEPLSGNLIDWSKKKIKDHEIYVSQTDPGFGREDEMHITILYGIHSENSDKIKELVSGYGKISVEFGEVDIFTNDKFDVVFVSAISQDLNKLNNKICDGVEYTNKYKDYKPHATLAYVKKGKGWKYHGLRYWKGKKFTVDNVVFSSKSGEKEIISLT